MRKVAVVIAIAAVALGGFVILARTGALSPSEAELRAHYMLPSSKIVEIDGEPIHVSDEGQGEPIVLVHGSFGSLLMWNDWAAALKDRYRVIRFDLPPAGLSGPNPKNACGFDHSADVLDALTTKLGLETFYLAATSSGGAPATQYAAAHPERIKGIVLSNIAVGPLKADPTRNPWLVRQLRKTLPLLKGRHFEAEVRGMLERNILHREKITDALVTEWTQLNSRRAAFAASQAPRGKEAPFARTPADLEKIAAPALVLWSENDSEIPAHPVADDAMKHLASQDKTMVIVPQCEHMMPLDCGPESAAAARAFFDRLSPAP